MKKAIIFLSLSMLFVTISFVLECSAEKEQLQENIIRLHVIANSDSGEDQAQKLRVRDAVIDYLSPLLSKITSTNEARDCIAENILQLENVVATLLYEEGTDMSVSVSLTEACFDTRYYETFALPAGVYSALRIELGDGAGKNWWCVAFPSLCMPAAGKNFNDVAVSVGFSDNLTNSLGSGNKYEVRFFVLDLLGRIENFFYNR